MHRPWFITSILEAENRAPKITRIPDYQELNLFSFLTAYNGNQPGNPRRGLKLWLMWSGAKVL